MKKFIKEIKRLNTKKACQKSDILITIIHEDADICGNFLAESWKGAIKTYNFPDSLKLLDITTLHKKGTKGNKENYRPERILFEQISVYFDKFLSDQQCEFCKGYSTQHCLFEFIRKMEGICW